MFKRKRVGLLIIGAQKCGTTSLHSYLDGHSGIVGSKPKEVDYFSYDNNYLRGDKWYHRHFSSDKGSKTTYLLDSSVEYMYVKEARIRIHMYNPRMKFIVLLRNPVFRAFSAYQMYRRLNLGFGLSEYENHLIGHSKFYRDQMLRVLKRDGFPTFEEFVEIEMEMIRHKRDYYEPSFLNRGLYFDQLSFFYKNFPGKNIMIIESNNFRNNKESVLKRIFNWLGIEEKVDFDVSRNLLEGNHAEEIDHFTYERLSRFFVMPNQQLYNLVGQKFNWDEI